MPESPLRVVSVETTTMVPPVITTRWLNAAEAAAYLEVSENKLREMRAEWASAHPGRRIEKRIGDRGIRFTGQDLDALLEWWDEELTRRENPETPLTEVTR